MAAPGWRTDRPLTQQLAHEPSRFDFYQLVRLLLIERDLDMDQLDRGVRFRGDLGQAFPGHEVRALAASPAAAHGKPPVAIVETANYALAGYLGPLPEALVDQLLARWRDGDVAWARFLDIFNHRLNALRYRLKAAPRPALNMLPLKADSLEQTPLARMLLALIGLGEPALTAQLRVPVRSVLGLAGLLADRRRSAPRVTRVVARFVGAPVAFEPFAGAWRALSDGIRTRLGDRGQAQSLGQLCRLGDGAWLPGAAIRLVIGPLGFDTYRRLLPKRQGGDEDLHPRFAWLIRFLLDRRQDAWITLRLAAGEAPPARLSASGAEFGLRLGQTAWLQGRRDQERQAEFLIPSFAAEAA
jgi:type VI secretion system protein ImpH